MKTRAEIKSLGRDQFCANYWLCVGASLLVALLISVASGTFIGGIVLVGPLGIGLNYFYVQLIHGAQVDMGTPFSSAFENFGRKLGGFLWAQLFTFLWSLLFVIPGIVKSFSYALTPYILADCPNVKATDALKLSMRIMDGKKWTLFVFYLSFIGWGFLSAITCGLLAVLYVTPYMGSSMAAFYLEAREDALRSGVISREELDGAVAPEAPAV